MIDKLDYIYNGDCVELLSQLPDKSIDCIITDPPYEFVDGGSGKTSPLAKQKRALKDQISDIIKGFDYDKILTEWVRVMKKVNIYIWCNKMQIPRYIDYFVNKLGCNFEILMWYKTNAIPSINNNWMPDAEYCLYFRESGVKLYGDTKTKTHCLIEPINIKDKQRWLHPTIKPLRFIENFIINSTDEGDIVLDTFMGSGTTAVACKMHNRHFIGAEVNKEYYQMCMNRLKEFNFKGLFE